MNCPIDGTALVMSDRNGVEIDYCPQCRGVWLDRGELDKVIERSLGQPGAAAPAQPQQQPYVDQGYGYGGGHHGGGYDKHGNRRNNRRGWLGELFD